MIDPTKYIQVTFEFQIRENTTELCLEHFREETEMFPKIDDKSILSWGHSIVHYNALEAQPYQLVMHLFILL